jgi:6-phosphogluconolactonase
MMINPLQFGHDHLHIRLVSGTSELVGGLAGFVASRLAQAIERRGSAVLAVSGGRSPRDLLIALAELPLPWSRISVILVDERAAGSLHPLSNTARIREWLLRSHARQADFVSFAPVHDRLIDDVEGLARAANLASDGLPEITVGILGIGLDGHFASIFAQPGCEALLRCGAIPAYHAVRLNPQPPEDPVDRISLSLAKLLRADALVLPVSGEAKMRALRRALEEPSVDWPVSLLMHQAVCPLHVWLEESVYAH